MHQKPNLRSLFSLVELKAIREYNGALFIERNAQSRYVVTLGDQDDLIVEGTDIMEALTNVLIRPREVKAYKDFKGEYP